MAKGQVSLEKRLQDMIDILEANKPEAAKADGGNAAAGKRFRAGIALIPPMIKVAKNQSLGK